LKFAEYLTLVLEQGMVHAASDGRRRG
jgi:hypothetical protein